ncbi:MAG: glycosyltransferase [Rhodobacteraceae bacterium]|nr:glycosyltransferase [Paracoccaceae bacterium]
MNGDLLDRSVSAARPSPVAATFDTSIIIPAHNEEEWLPACIASILAQDESAGRLEILVMANACTDGTVRAAESFARRAEARGWRLVVRHLVRGSKTGAFNAGDDIAQGRNRVYLDADVTCDPDLLGQIRVALDTEVPRYATGTFAIVPPESWVSRRFADAWSRLPFIKGGAVGAGFFAVNPAGRARWQAFPDVFCDDSFVRLHFGPEERVEVPARYHWPIAEGFTNLVRVRRRQDAAIADLRRRRPDLVANEAMEPVTPGYLLRLAWSVPAGFVVFALVKLGARLRPPTGTWTRGR